MQQPNVISVQRIEDILTKARPAVASNQRELTNQALSLAKEIAQRLGRPIQVDTSVTVIPAHVAGESARCADVTAHVNLSRTQTQEVSVEMAHPFYFNAQLREVQL